MEWPEEPKHEEPEESNSIPATKAKPKKGSKENFTAAKQRKRKKMNAQMNASAALTTAMPTAGTKTVFGGDDEVPTKKKQKASDDLQAVAKKLMGGGDSEGASHVEGDAEKKKKPEKKKREREENAEGGEKKEPYKRKKTRSRQKNLKKDTRPESEKPSFLTPGSSDYRPTARRKVNPNFITTTPILTLQSTTAEFLILPLPLIMLQDAKQLKHKGDCAVQNGADNGAWQQSTISSDAVSMFM